MNAFARIRPKGGSKPDPPSFFPWRLQWGLSVFQWGSNPHNPPPPPVFTLEVSIPSLSNQVSRIGSLVNT